MKKGMLHAAGERVLFVDADGASHFPDLDLLEKEMDIMELTSKTKEFFGIVVGSRAHLVQTEAVVKVRIMSPDSGEERREEEVS